MGIVIPFDEWTPDLPDYRNGTTEAQNVIPRLRGYVSFSSLTAYSTSLSGRCQGFASALDSGGNTNTYLGDKLYRLVDEQPAPTDASNGPADRQWNASACKRGDDSAGMGVPAAKCTEQIIQADLPRVIAVDHQLRPAA